MITCYCNLLVFSEEEVVIYEAPPCRDTECTVPRTTTTTKVRERGRLRKRERETVKVLREEEKERKRACNFMNIFLRLLSLSQGW